MQYSVVLSFYGTRFSSCLEPLSIFAISSINTESMATHTEELDNIKVKDTFGHDVERTKSVTGKL